MQIKNEKKYKKTLFKSRFGSFDCYANDSHIVLKSGFAFRSSALGGFSNVWGATIQRFSKTLVEDWEIDHKDWKASEQNIRAFFRNSDSEEIGLKSSNLFLSSKIESLFDRKQKRHSFKETRLAMSPIYEPCNGCGQCLLGCPTHSIWNAGLTRLLDSSFKDDLLLKAKVRNIEKNDDSTLTLVTTQNQRITSKRVFLGAGALGTAEILLNSKLCAPQILAKDSQYFIFLALCKNEHFRESNTIGLSEASLDLNLPEPVYIQIYDFLNPAFKKMLLDYLKNVFVGKYLISLLETRLLILQSYLHSKDSGTLTIEPTSSGLEVKANRKLSTIKIILKTYLKLLTNCFDLGFFVLPFIKVMQVGESFHVGASLPMSSSPKVNTVNLQGEMWQCAGLYVVDSSSLVEIPAQPPTLGVMTNADRIVRNAH